MTHLDRMLREREDGTQITLSSTQKFSWDTIAGCDILFQQRPFKPDHLTIAQIAKDCGKPVWVDYDDDLFNVPADNPTYAQYGAEKIQQTVATVIALADHVTVSTKHLKRRLEPLNKNITVVPNALNEKMIYYRDNTEAMRGRLALWRGSSTHQRDVATFSHPLIDMSQKHKKWTWMFVGYNPWFATEYMNNALVSPPLDILEYHKFIHNSKPAVTIVPLHNNLFNLSKSNIAWLETIFAGGIAIGPNWEEWQQPGCINYEGVDDFEAKLDAFITGMESEATRTRYKRMNEDAWEHVKQNFTLENVNQLRLEVIRELATYKPTRLIDYGPKEAGRTEADIVERAQAPQIVR